jgi:two-component system phosphate regulon sensor histidine kinase PhoR
LRLGRGLYITVTLIVACGLLTGALVNWQSNLAQQHGNFAGYLQRIPLIPIIYVIGAVGVILLGWFWLKLAGAITSIAMFGKNKLILNNEEQALPGGIGLRQLQRMCEIVVKSFEDDIRRIEKYEEQVKELQLRIQLSQRREKNTEAIIYSIRDAVIVIDEFDRLLMANAAAGRLFEFDYKRSQHIPVNDLVADDKMEFLDFLLQSRRSTRRAKRKEIQLTIEDEPRIFDCIVSCVYDQNNRVCGAVVVLHDITREKEISQMKNDFVSHVSHELKTPLASITAYSEMLCDGEADDEKTRKEFYSVIQNQARRLSRLIEDILNTSRIESGLIKVDKETASLTMLIEEQMQMIQNYAEEKGIKVTGQKPIVFDQVYVCKDMISQVIVNLLSNAVKYTPSGGSVKIETEVDEHADLVRVKVTDTGVGIPEDEIDHVFDKFYRVRANNKHAKGTGLGLNLVKQIIEKVHKGRVFVTSKVGVGSTFGFELPLAKKEAITAGG